MQLFQNILGHTEQIEKLLHSLQQGGFGRMFLFVGPSGVGKRKTAWGIAQSLLCENQIAACGHCPSCLRVAQGNHEGILQIQPDRMQIKVDQAREVIEFLSLKSISRVRVIIMDQAQTMNQYASNSLLKIMEEPPDNTYFFLIAPSSVSVLPTIRSRAQIISFKPVSEELMRASLKDKNTPKWAMKFAKGSYEKLLSLTDEFEQEVRNNSMEIFKFLVMDKDFLLNEKWREHFKDRTLAQKIIYYWMAIVKDAICVQERATSFVVNEDQKELLSELQKIPQSRLIDMLKGCLEMERDILSNTDVTLLVEKFWVLNHV